MKFNPLISVIIPVYNGANYVGEAIESVLAQTYKKFEILVIDDGSTDGGATRAAVEPYFDKIRYIRQENGGVGAALNTGIKNMKGQYFGWLSHDDIFLKEKLREQVEALGKLKDRKVALFSDYAIVNEKLEHQYDVAMDAEMLRKSSNHIPVLRGCLNGCTMLIHKAIFKKCGVFKPELRFTQDYEMWDRISWNFPLIHFAKVTVHQRLHSSQDSHKPDALIEANNLWINLVKSRNKRVQAQISGSSFKFLEDMKGFLIHTPYREAIAYVEKELEKAQKPAGNEKKKLTKDFKVSENLEINTEVTVEINPIISKPILDGAIDKDDGKTPNFDIKQASKDRTRKTGVVAREIAPTTIMVINKNPIIDGINYPVGKPRVSIIMPTFNRGHCIKRAMESVLQQTWSNWELLIVDDGSSDNTEEIVKSEYRRFGHRINYLKIENQGVSTARNIAIKRACGQFIAFLDSDDYYQPDKLELQVSALLSNEDAVMAYTNWSTFYSENEPATPSHPIPKDLEGDIYPKLISVDNCFITTPSVMVRRSAIMNTKLFNTSMHICEDIDLWRRISRKGKVIKIDKPLIAVHLRKDERFKYAESIEARMKLYANAYFDDPELDYNIIANMMADIYKVYCDVSIHRKDYNMLIPLRQAEIRARRTSSIEQLLLINSECVTTLKNFGSH